MIETILAKIGGVIGGALLVISSWFSPIVIEQPLDVGASVQPFAGQTYTLSGAGVSSSATSITLSSFTNPQSGYEIQDGDLSATFYLTIEPGNRTRQEIVSCTTVAQSGADTSATLSGCTRGLPPLGDPASLNTGSSTLRFAHSGGSQVVFSNPPQLYNQFAAKANDETITGLYTFNTILPTTSIAATTSNQFANKAYVDSVANQGAATSTESNGGIVELGTLAEQANSTDGGATTPRVLQTKNSTSTCQVVGSYNIVASSTSGKLDRNCFDQSLAYTFTATSTFNATTSIAAATNTAPLLLNGIDYGFPSVEGASSTVLSTNGVGSLSWIRLNGLTYSGGTNTNVSAASGNTSTSTALVIPAGVLTASSTIIVYGTVNWTEGGTGVVMLRDGTGSPFTGTSVSGADNGSGDYVSDFTFIVRADNSLTSQINQTHGTRVTPQATNSCGGAACSYVSNIYTEGTSSINFANAVSFNIVVTGVTQATDVAGYSILVIP